MQPLVQVLVHRLLQLVSSLPVELGPGVGLQGERPGPESQPEAPKAVMLLLQVLQEAGGGVPRVVGSVPECHHK